MLVAVPTSWFVKVSPGYVDCLPLLVTFLLSLSSRVPAPAFQS
jgi:hypothetical protein